MDGAILAPAAHSSRQIGSTPADRSLLTIFGENNDPLGFQPAWAERFARIEQFEVPNGSHFPMCDDPGLVANAIRTWHHQTT